MFLIREIYLYTIFFNKQIFNLTPPPVGLNFSVPATIRRAEKTWKRLLWRPPTERMASMACWLPSIARTRDREEYRGTVNNKCSGNRSEEQHKPGLLARASESSQPISSGRHAVDLENTDESYSWSLAASASTVAKDSSPSCRVSTQNITFPTPSHEHRERVSLICRGLDKFGEMMKN